MSSFSRRLALRTCALFIAATALSACGFRPLHGQYSEGDNPGSSANLAAVYIKPIPDRSGQIMRTAMERRFSPTGQREARYILSVNLTESIAKLAVEQNAFATRANLTLTASYVLERAEDYYQFPAGKTIAVSSYNILASNYATLTAEQNARERAVETLANDLRTRIAILLSAPASDPAGGKLLP